MTSHLLLPETPSWICCCRACEGVCVCVCICCTTPRCVAAELGTADAWRFCKGSSAPCLARATRAYSWSPVRSAATHQAQQNAASGRLAAECWAQQDGAAAMRAQQRPMLGPPTAAEPCVAPRSTLASIFPSNRQHDSCGNRRSRPCAQNRIDYRCFPLLADREQTGRSRSPRSFYN